MRHVVLNFIIFFCIMLAGCSSQASTKADKSGKDSAAAGDKGIEKATKSLMANAARADADPTRPVYHYRPPSGWMSDPTGPIYYKDYYHTFYLLNPYDSRGWPYSRNHWGHARSRDLVFWEHLPIALVPLPNREHRCNSGCLTLDGNGRPLIFYTHVSMDKKVNQQWAAAGDKQLITWKRVPENPILSLKTHDGPQFSNNWRDPFIFKEQGRVFMILTAKLDKKAVAPIYEAADDSLLKWHYRGIMFDVPDTLSGFLECPNFVKLGSKWVLIGSGLGKNHEIMYFVGSLDMQTLRFTPETQGLLDHKDNFLYATNTLLDSQGRCILLGRIRHFQKEKAWSGCLALPRILSLDSQNRLIQQPVPALKKLRQKHDHGGPLSLDSNSHPVKEAHGDTLEIIATFEPGTAKAFGLNLRCSPDGKRGVLVRYDGSEFSFGDHVEGKLLPCSHHSDRPDVPGGVLPFQLPGDNDPLTLHIFLDKSVMEIFVNNGQACATRVIYPDKNDLGIELFAEQGTVVVKSLDIWTMKPIWNLPATK